MSQYSSWTDHEITNSIAAFSTIVNDPGYTPDVQASYAQIRSDLQAEQLSRHPLLNLASGNKSLLILAGAGLAIMCLIGAVAVLAYLNSMRLSKELRTSLHQGRLRR